MLETKMAKTNIFYLLPTHFVSNIDVTTPTRSVKNPFLFTEKSFSAQFFILIRLNGLNQFLLLAIIDSQIFENYRWTSVYCNIWIEIRKCESSVAHLGPIGADWISDTMDKEKTQYVTGYLNDPFLFSKP